MTHDNPVVSQIQDTTAKCGIPYMVDRGQSLDAASVPVVFFSKGTTIRGKPAADLQEVLLK